MVKEMQQRQAEMQAVADEAVDRAEAQAEGGSKSGFNASDGFVDDDPSTWGDPGRNDSCPCGSGKKFIIGEFKVGGILATTVLVKSTNKVSQVRE